MAEGSSECRVRLRQFRFESHRGPEFASRAFRIATFQIRQAEVIVRFPRVGLKAES